MKRVTVVPKRRDGSRVLQSVSSEGVMHCQRSRRLVETQRLSFVYQTQLVCLSFHSSTGNGRDGPLMELGSEGTISNSAALLAQHMVTGCRWKRPNQAERRHISHHLFIVPCQFPSNANISIIW